jgi:serine/threonine-protein kinase
MEIEGRYRLDTVLGQGGMATVYRAWQKGLERWVAVKHCRQDLDPFREEARLLAGLHHPALVTVHELIENPQEAYLVMELVEGITLRQRVDQQLPGEAQCLRWLEELLAVLEYLHSQNPPIILKDLKPDNVMVEPSGRLRVLDFGIAKRLGEGTQLLLKGVGSEYYAPLEQYGQGSTDQRSDFYALGATLYFALTGSDPMPAWQRLARHQDLVLGQDVSPSTRELVRRLTALFAQDRPPDEDSIRRGSPASVEATRVDAPPPGRSRPLQAELRQRWDLGDSYADSVLEWADPSTLWVAGATLRRLQVNPLRVMQDLGPTRRPLALAIAHDGRRLAMATRDRGLLGWQAGGKSLATSGWEGGECQWLRFASNQVVLALSQNGQLASYRFPEGRKIRSFGPQQWWYRFRGHRLLTCQADLRRLAAAASDGSLFVWEHGSGELLWQSHQPSPTRCLDFSQDGQFLVSASQDGSLSLWQAEAGQRLLRTALEQPWQALHCHPRAVLGIEADAVVVWDLSNACPRLRLQMPESISASALSPGGWLACLLSNGRLLVLDLDLSQDSGHGSPT